ncbi:MAG: hypothetical protein A2998_00480 [Candidatus Staskawiczbacteria bacterium RIFCSPLOWO2_01_FULL_37_25b]|uniref:DUF4015 domain-containing protein n=2 Tax=Candidatus Staskawicziibacteriota TaxID=1817916 RepID=A0A1G2HJT7_9BACT|nr:MAG: hypothetical protein A2812_00460 [Candidatus Staskawiczbacteria bacterium RIFCSPHIGHO2_01_FULL_36_16]OGZ71775.1 MAG: hypothetical protein A2998_00480 [Candidatus Staskawiczbacteria bacterium RIFCSPLOWO2_01_FULL_37_25b]
MEFSMWKNFSIVLLVIVVFTTGAYFVVQSKAVFVLEKTDEPPENTEIQNNVLSVNDNSQSRDEKMPELPVVAPLLPPQKLSSPPEIIKAVYVTGYSAGVKSYINYLADIFKTTEINAVVIDIKGSSGYISYVSNVKDAKKYNTNSSVILDIDSLIRFFHDKNIYVIGRIAVFEDPLYSKARPDIAIYNKGKTADLSKPVLWRDNSGLLWIDPASTDAWDYNISIAKDALNNHGFDEINFDYIRFPSDGDMENLGFPVWDQKIPKREIIKEFFRYARVELKGEKISADLFGQTTVNTDDMGIGQVIEDALEYFDYISPMVYPSHYINGFIGFQNPAGHPYEVVKYSMENAVIRKSAYLEAEKNIALQNSEASGTPAQTAQQALNFYAVSLAKFRPWLQDFDMGADYTAEMVKQEITAVQDALREDFNGYMLWNPSNIYTKGAIELAK